MQPVRNLGLLLFLAAAGAVALLGQENTLRVSFEREGRRVEVVGSFRTGGTTYFCLTDVVAAARLNAYENARARKLEISLSGYRVKVTAGSPFLVISSGTRQSVVQLPHNALYAAGRYFLPLEESLSYLQILLGQPVALDRDSGLIRAGVEPASAFDIPSVRFEPKTNGMLIRIIASRRIGDVESWYRDGWLYVTIPDARADTTAIQAVPPVGIVREIVAIQSPTSVQLTFRLGGSIAATEVVRDEASNDILLAVREETKTPVVPPPSRLTPSGQSGHRDRWKLDVIVLDAGHGGKDPGTIGVTGTREKDITLPVTLKLGRLIERNLPGVKVVYTRTTDRFVELYRRGQIANEASGKLFISVHANSVRQRPSPRGFEVYLLRPGRTEEAIAIAEQENSVIEMEEGYENRYKELTEENFILVTMAQSAHGRASEQFADLLLQEIDRSTSLRNRGVKQAGFYVLVGASMPNVLIETAYLSNRNDEKFLRSEAGQQKIADSVFRAVKRYKEEYDKLLRE
jgi:N-acetylmuramoyl-L-alanine amidase